MVKTVSTNFVLASLAAAALAGGCVDARGAYDDYRDRLVDASTQNVDGQIVSELPDASGRWLIAVWPANLPEDRIIQFDAMLTQTPVTANTAKIDISAQPLTVADRTAVGDAFIANNQDVDHTASFNAPFNGTLPGAANPVSGTDAAVNAQMQATIKTDQFLCGTLTGMAGPLPLDGTQWAAVRITSDTLPAPIFRCADQPQ